MTYLALGQARIQQQPQDQRQQLKFPDLRLERKAIEAFVTRHYDKDNRALNLSNLSAFLPKVKSINLNDKRFAILLESVLAISCPDVLSLALNQNNISKLGAVSYLLHNRLKIINLSLDSNQISNFNELSVLKDVDLRELVLSQNPICTENNESTFKLEVVRRVPALYMLNGTQVKQEDNHPHTQLPAIQDSCFESETIKNLASGFLSKYYAAFDGDRDSLVGAYSEQAQFSLSHIPTSQPKGRSQSSFRADLFAPYTPLDRNLATNKSTDKIATCLKVGPTHIVGTLLDLPTSKHDLPSFTFDCVVVQVGIEMLTITVQGSFLESNKKKRSFSRVFLLVPAPSNPKHEGWPFVIINDQFYVRHFQQRSKPTQPQLPSPPLTPTESEMQELMTRLAAQTIMTLEGCKECLQCNQWNMDRAFADYQSLLANDKLPQQFKKN